METIFPKMIAFSETMDVLRLMDHPVPIYYIHIGICITFDDYKSIT